MTKFIADAKTELLAALAARFPESSKTTLRQMLQQGRVRVNGAIEKVARRELVPGDRIEIGRHSQLPGISGALSILYEDDDIIVVIKSAGLLSVASKLETEQTAEEYINTYLRAGVSERVHVIHRLDLNTSGTMMFAKSPLARDVLKKTFAEHDIDRVYVAIVEGGPPTDEGTIRSYLREDERTLEVRTVGPHDRGKLAITHYKVVDRGKYYSMLEVTLETGRRNQIRAQFASKGFPIAGDARFGAKSDPIGRLALHARTLGFAHPRTGKKLLFNAPLPDGFHPLPTAFSSGSRR
ncbi:MAG: RluA family pseudouridine synthase [Acidobacteria bacterium]|nr:RluA family pseudouridine synthase [Acidobacteriota bacterium]